MASLSCLTSLVLVMAMAIGVVQSGPRNIVRRQASDIIDTSHISDPKLLECFTNLAAGGECADINSINSIAVKDVEEAPGCRCVPAWQCQDNTNPTANSIDGSLLTLVNVRTSCFDPLDTCCINIDTSATSPAPPVEQPKYVSRCGQLKRQGVSATLVGFTENQAQFGQFPWMAAVMTTGIAGSQGANVYVCGASLIHPRVVLTVAHYMKDKVAQQLAVRLGEWNFKLPTEPIQHQDIRVQRIAIHPQYAANQLTYDVALLFLERDADLGPTVDTVCLPDPSEKFDGDSCYSSGWGKDIFGLPGKFQQILKSLKLPAVSHQQCENVYRGTRLGNTFNLHKTFMCAGGQFGVDACTGDGGSPLVCPVKSDPSRYVQAGLVAWGIGCGTHGVPGVYASVSEAVSWIGQELLTNMGFDVRAGVKKR